MEFSLTELITGFGPLGALATIVLVTVAVRLPAIIEEVLKHFRETRRIKAEIARDQKRLEHELTKRQRKPKAK